MKISPDEAIKLAQQVRENGACSAFGQALVHLLDALENIDRRLQEIEVAIERRKPIA